MYGEIYDKLSATPEIQYHGMKGMKDHRHGADKN
jgi:hypothetical protein